MITKKPLIPAILAVLTLAGCGTSAAAAGSNTGASSEVAAVSTSNHAGTGTGTAAGAPDSSNGIPSSALGFPVQVGDTWVVRATTLYGGTTDILTNKILSVVSKSNGTWVTESYTNSHSASFDLNSVWIFHPNGTITYPLGSMGGLQVTSSSGGFILPDTADITSGQAYHSTLKLTVRDDGQTFKETAHVTVQGVGTGTVSVPAGTYQNATIVEMDMAITVDGTPIDMVIKFWVAKGVGQVKSELLSGTGPHATVDSTEVLLSFTKG
jgi:hypothetical protein